ncbi:MAG: MBL fold metallo-hydrolase [Actinomycetes bacterium]
MGSLTWLGHATAVLDLDGVRLLSDPVLTPWVGPLRNTASPPASDLLADVDAVLVTHVHRDHLDLRSLARLGSGTRVVVPRGSADLLDGRLTGHVDELDVGESTRVGSLTVQATPAVHVASRRWRRVPALGFLVSGATGSIYLAGDTDLFAGMAEIAAAVPGRLGAALLPVGGWGLTLGPGHLDPRRAALAARVLRPRVAVPVHFGTLRIPALWRLRPRLLSQPGLAFAQDVGDVAPDVEVRVLAPGGSVPF